MACRFGVITRWVALDDTRQQVALCAIVPALTGLSGLAPEFVRAEADIAAAELEVAPGQKAGEGRSDDGASVEHEKVVASGNTDDGKMRDAGGAVGSKAID